MPPSVAISTDMGRQLPSAQTASANTRRVLATTSPKKPKRNVPTKRRMNGATRVPPVGSASLNVTGGTVNEDALVEETHHATAVESNVSLVSNSAAVMAGAGMVPYGGGMYGSPYSYGGIPPMMGMGGPFSGMYQLLFGVQNVVFSLTQAVQLMGTNQHALQQAFDALTGMIDHAIATFHELRQLEATETARETEEQKRRRRRLKALRWAFVVGSLWLLSKIIRRLTSRAQRRRIGYGGGNYSNASGPASYPRGNHGLVPYSNGYNTGFGSPYGGYSQGSSYGGMFGGGQNGVSGGYF